MINVSSLEDHSSAGREFKFKRILIAGSGSLFGTGSSASLFGSDAVAPLMCLQGR